MSDREALIDLIWEGLKKSRSGCNLIRKEERAAKRVFLSEFEIKGMIRGQSLKVPPRAILSPLALDWIVLKGIRIIQEDSIS